MSVNQGRSLNRDLGDGMVEGKYKSLHKGRGGEVDPANDRARSELSAKFDMVEQHPKIAPDGTLVP